jgi:hypothetical protein
MTTRKTETGHEHMCPIIWGRYATVGPGSNRKTTRKRRKKPDLAEGNLYNRWKVWYTSSGEDGKGEEYG